MSVSKDFRVLVVDDEEMIRENIGKFLERKGFEVLKAEDGLDAIKTLDGTKIDLVVSDVRMPNCDGIELLQNIQSQRNGRPPLIFVTGYSSVSEEESIKMGALAVFSKPINRKELLAKINSALNIKELV